MKRPPKPHRSWPRRIVCRAAAGIAFLTLIVAACFRGWAVQSEAPVTGSCANNGPDTAQPPHAGSAHVVTEATVLGRSNADGVVVWESLAAGTRVKMVRPGREWSEVRTADGAEGLVPTARLDPKLQWPKPPDPREALPVGKWGALPAPVEDRPLPLAKLRDPPAETYWPAQLTPVSPSGPAEVAESTVRAVRDADLAIAKAQVFLYSQQRHGNWEAVVRPIVAEPPIPGIQGAQWGELTGLCTYSLLASGGMPADKSHDRAGNLWLGAAIAWLADAPLRSPSAVAVRGQALSVFADRAERAPDTEPARLALRRLQALLGADARFLMAAAPDTLDHGPPAGLYPPEDGSAAPFDLEVSQAATAALIDLDSADPGRGTNYHWHVVRKAWANQQKADGSWDPPANGNTHGDDNGNAKVGPGVAAKVPPSTKIGATAAGAATLILVGDKIAPPEAADCKGAAPLPEVSKAWRWLDGDMIDIRGDYPAMWAVQRMLLASGRKRVATVDWQRLTRDYLVRQQLLDGSWPAAAGADPAGRRLAETAYALLVLNGCRTPVAVNKLDYDPPDPKRDPWAAQQRPRDAAHLVDWAGWELRRPLAWQWVRLKEPDDLEEAPILLVGGSDAVEFSPADVERLRTYVQHGGMILGNANCQSKAFVESFIRLGKQMFPRYEFRDLPDGHALFTGQTFEAANWAKVPAVRGLSNGVRELMLLPAVDLSRGLQARTYSIQPPPFELGFDILSYAQDPASWPRRGEVRPVERVKEAKPKLAVRVARLMAGDNPDPETGGWERLANLMHNHSEAELELAAVTPGDGTLTRAKDPFRVAHLTGTGKLAVTPAMRDEIKSFVAGGGTLIVDAAGGSKEFADAAAAELAQMFPPPNPPSGAPAVGPGDVLPADHDVYRLRDNPIRQFAYRRFAQGKIAGDAKRPHLRGIAVGNRIAVFFSAEDLSAGLTGADTDGIVGYAPDTAVAILRNVLLYAAGER